MPSLIKFAAAALAVAQASAQTYTTCNPLDKTCPADKGTTVGTQTFDFTQSLDQWTTTAGTVDTGSNGAVFTVAKQGDAPTIETDFYIFFGEVSVVMKAAPGTGIVSSLVFESDDLDEIDWEALGGDSTTIETNYFGKGDTTTYNRATWDAVSDPQDTWHTYTVSWQKDATTWSIDGNVVRTLTYDDATSGTRYPQTPMRIRIGIWAGGDPTNGEGTIEWAGGETDYSDAPFSMYVKSVSITNANPAESYTYSDTTGSMDSIVLGGAAALSQTDSTTSTTSTSSSSSSQSSATTTTTTVPTTLATTTQSSTSTSTAQGSTTSTTGSSSSSSGSETTSGSATSGSGSATTSGSSSAAGSGSASGSGSSTTGSSSESSGSTSGSSTAASASPTYNAAVNMASNYLGPISILALITAFLQL
ncbi:hypothetical protein N7466_001303 [Penicillium verhagenii]|uniref:uncharacterized protein n=1 Tax=Penicillium verhagenii TaxID=1562060 RepID=UPI00254588AE|nr:uncharacterized protein N7466_001303 [Penicillium verhagenii]KAJ5948288.1 hypothetical protein N7466_001303 [Penicillium verhagenii]